MLLKFHEANKEFYKVKVTLGTLNCLGIACLKSLLYLCSVIYVCNSGELFLMSIVASNLHDLI